MNLNMNELITAIDEDYETVKILETNEERSFVSLCDIQNSDPIELLEIVLLAYDSGLYLGSFFADSNGGELTIYE